MIEQAERAEVLKTKNLELLDLNDITPYQISVLEDENKRLREVLKFYADPRHYYYETAPEDAHVMLDEGDKAKSALEETK